MEKSRERKELAEMVHKIAEDNRRKIYNKAIDDFVHECYEWNQESSKRIPYKAIQTIAERLKNEDL